jgi:hypothetical protein
VDTQAFEYEGNFKDNVLRINKKEPSEIFAETYLQDSIAFMETARVYRSTENEVIEK